MLKLHSISLRTGLKEVLKSVSHELVIASPYIKTSEAEWVCDELERRKLPSSVHLQVLTDVRSTNVLSGSLDIEALNLFTARIPASVVVNLPRLHAKVYVADHACALITSANLTPSGMDFNFEFGVEFHDSKFVGSVRRHLESYSRLGNILSRQSLAELQIVADELSAEFQKVQKSAASGLKRRFSEKLRTANYQFLVPRLARARRTVFSPRQFCMRWLPVPCPPWSSIQKSRNSCLICVMIQSNWL